MEAPYDVQEDVPVKPLEFEALGELPPLPL